MTIKDGSRNKTLTEEDGPAQYRKMNDGLFSKEAVT